MSNIAIATDLGDALNLAGAGITIAGIDSAVVPCAEANSLQFWIDITVANGSPINTITATVSASGRTGIWVPIQSVLSNPNATAIAQSIAVVAGTTTRLQITTTGQRGAMQGAKITIASNAAGINGDAINIRATKVS